MRTVRYLPQAREELLHEAQYFSTISLELARDFSAAVRKAEALAAEFAEMGMPFGHGTRRVIPGKFKFSIVYTTTQREIVVIAVAPQQRRPGYWRGRLLAARPVKSRIDPSN